MCLIDHAPETRKDKTYGPRAVLPTHRPRCPGTGQRQRTSPTPSRTPALPLHRPQRALNKGLRHPGQPQRSAPAPGSAGSLLQLKDELRKNHSSTVTGEGAGRASSRSTDVFSLSNWCREDSGPPRAWAQVPVGIEPRLPPAAGRSPAFPGAELCASGRLSLRHTAVLGAAVPCSSQQQ